MLGGLDLSHLRSAQELRGLGGVMPPMAGFPRWGAVRSTPRRSEALKSCESSRPPTLKLSQLVAPPPGLAASGHPTPADEM